MVKAKAYWFRHPALLKESLVLIHGVKPIHRCNFYNLTTCRRQRSVRTRTEDVILRKKSNGALREEGVKKRSTKTGPR